MTHRIALIGFGVVGQGLAEILLQKQDILAEQEGMEIDIVAVSDKMKGSLYHPDGLDIRKLLSTVQETGSIEGYPDTSGLIRGWDSLETIEQSNADTIIEVTFTDVKTGEPGISHCKAALQAGKNVITSNKGPLALAYQELIDIAEQNHVQLGYEGTVMSGTPSLRMPTVSLAGNEISEIRGIFNGTTNYMLTRMEEGLDYAEALKEAQDLGYAEADPTSDVEGYDVLYKVMILSQVLMRTQLDRTEVEREGISQISLQDVQQAKSEGKRWKLLARIKQDEEGIQASVRPEKIDLSDPLAGVGGAINAITYECDLSGPITLMGAGAGKLPTGFSILIDLINIIRDQKKTK